MFTSTPQTSASSPYKWDNFETTSVGQYLTATETNFIRRVLRNSNFKRGLEIACGSGRITALLRREGLHTVGLEPDMEALKGFRQREPSLAALRADANDLPFADASFDFACAIQCVEYFDLPHFFSECNRVLRPEGTMIFNIVNRNNYKRWINRLRGSHKSQDDNFEYSFGQMRAFLKQKGFAVIAQRGFNWIPFDRYSNSKIVPLTARVESALGLGRLLSVSPWINFAIKKVA